MTDLSNLFSATNNLGTSATQLRNAVAEVVRIANDLGEPASAAGLADTVEAYLTEGDNDRALAFAIRRRRQLAEEIAKSLLVVAHGAPDEGGYATLDQITDGLLGLFLVPLPEWHQ
jgi:hypothetical protein